MPQEDIGAQFGEKIAIHYYGATEEEKAELEKAAQQDEENELRKGGADNEKVTGIHQEEITTKKV